jgi:5-methyltetrahydropteroyltriglutamate--homocysteine methyltransferase
LTKRPVKFGTILPELLAAAVDDDYYKGPIERCWSFSEALNEELQALADAGCPVGVIDHHTLQIERPDQVAGLIRGALRHIAPERLIISSDCGMGREGMSRRHAQYKMVAMVLGTNMVRKEVGIPEAECLAADPLYSLAL